MFNKLVRFEVKQLWQSLRSIWGGIILIYCLSLVGLLFQNSVLNVFSTLTSIITFLVMGLGPTIIITMRYYRTMAGQEAYFTHTIPASSAKIFASKFLVAYFVQLMSFLFLIPMIYNFIRFTLATSMVGLPFGVSYAMAGKLIHANFNFNFSLVTWLLVLALLLFTTFSLLISIFFSVAKGSESRFHHLGVGGPIIVYFILYFAQQILAFAAMVFIPLGIRFTIDSEHFTQFSLVFESSFENLKNLSAQPNPSSGVIGMGMMPLFVIVSVVLLFWTLHSHKSKTSVR